MKTSWIRFWKSLVPALSLLTGQILPLEVAFAEGDNTQRTLWEYYTADDDNKATLRIDLNAVPGWSDKVYEGQICPSKNAPPDVDTECYDNSGLSNGEDVNKHTRGFFRDINNNANFGPSQMVCSTYNNPSRLAVPCRGNLDGSPKIDPATNAPESMTCFSDYECCSGYCDQDGTDINFNGPQNDNIIPVGKKGTCKPKPNQNYVSLWPFRPTGKLGGVACASDSECQSKNCESDPLTGEKTCKSARFCKRCTPVGKRASYGAPCCGQSIAIGDSNICTEIDWHFQPAEVGLILGTFMTENSVADAKQNLLTDGVTTGLEIKVTSGSEINQAGRSCSFQYIVQGANQTTDGSADPAVVKENNKNIGKALTRSLQVQESILAAFEFLQLFKHENNSELKPDDVFGIHKNLSDTLLNISQSRYNNFQLQRRHEKEKGDEALAIRALTDPMLRAKLMAEGSQAVKDLIAQKEAAVASGENGASKGAQLDLLQFEIDGAAHMSAISKSRKDVLMDSFNRLMTEYYKDDKDHGNSHSTASNDPKKFSLFTWMKDNRRAGETMQSKPWDYLTDTRSDNDGIGNDTSGDKKQWAPQEEVNEGGWEAEEGEEGRESCNIQTGVIFRTSTRCKYTERQEEVTEDVSEFETEESFLWEMSRYCIGKGDAAHSTGHGKGVSKLVNYNNYPYLKEHNPIVNFLRELGLEWIFNHADVSYITTYPVLFHDKAGNLITDQGRWSRNIRDNFTAYVRDPVKYTRGLVQTENPAYSATENFYTVNDQNVLLELARDDFHMLENIVYFTSISFTRMQPAHYRDAMVLFLANLIKELAVVYEQLEKGYAAQQVCFQAVKDSMNQGGGNGNNPNGPTINPGAPNSNSVAAPNLSNLPATGSGSGAGSGVGFGNMGSGVGFNGLNGGIGQTTFGGGGSFNTLDSQRNASQFKSLSSQLDSTMSTFAKKRDRFMKNFKGTAVGRRGNALSSALNKGLKSIIADAKRAYDLGTAKGKGGTSSSTSPFGSSVTQGGAGNGSGSGSGHADNSDAEQLKRLRENMNGGGDGGGSRGGGGGGGLFGGGDSGGSSGTNFAGNSGGGTEDSHGLIDASKRERENYENKEEDSLFKIITNRYMKSLDKILIRKK